MTIGRLKSLLRKLPGFGRIRNLVYRTKPYGTKFRAYYLDRGWNCAESASGPGSTLEATRAIREALPALIRNYAIRSIVDIPCGDFNWMRTLDLSGVDYRGFDIVREMVEADNARYGRSNIRFGCLDVMRDALPRADLVICRDCLFHYTNRHILRGLRNIRRSMSRYLFTSTFPTVPVNEELYAVGWFRPINLQAPPFDLPEPLAMVTEEPDRGKSMGLWAIDGIGVR